MRQSLNPEHSPPGLTFPSEAPAEDNDLFRLAVEASPAGIFVVDATGQIELANAEGERLFGYAPGAMVDLSIDQLVPEPRRSGHRELRAHFEAVPSKRQMGAGRDLRAAHRDGHEFPVEIGLTPIQRPQGFAVLAVVVDITARRESEKLIQAKVAELERANTSLAHFAFVASHDIQEPLRKIVAFSDLLQSAVEDNDAEEIAMTSGVMRAAAKQARTLVSGILSFAHSLNDAYKVQTLSIVDVVEAALGNLSRAIADSGARIERDVRGFAFQGDRTQAIQLVQNVIENAIKYSKPGAAPRISVSAAQGEDGAQALTIRDDGIGFPAQRREEIFEPFKRLHGRDVYAGSGLGLAICKAIADRHGWRLSADSTPNDGASFEVLFKRGAEPAVG